MLLFFSAKNVDAQLDTRHYFPPLYSDNSVDQHYLVLSTPLSIPFAYEVTDGTGNVIFTGTISQNSPATIVLEDFNFDHDVRGVIDEDSLNTPVVADGLIITGQGAFFASIRHKTSNQATILSSKGSLALGTEFRAGHAFTRWRASQRNHFTSVMATEDSTIVKFHNPSVGYIGHTFGDTITVMLNEGESYVIAQEINSVYNGTESEFNGTHILSNHPVVVNSGTWLGGPITTAHDIGADQIVPVNLAGNSYVFMHGEHSDLTREKVIIVATQDNTQLYFNGSPVPATTLVNAGDYFIADGGFWTVAGNMYLSCSAPIMAYQTVFADDANDTQGMILVPPLNNCAGVKQIELSNIYLTGSDNVFLNIIGKIGDTITICLLYTSPSPRDEQSSRMPSSA